MDLITNDAGGIVVRLGYTPYGKRRDMNALQAMTSYGSLFEINFTAVVSNRGFTGHEHIDELDLVHMNGRVYDPETGRFLSADPYVFNPYSTQGLNRYSYVMGNPMKYRDPSGFWAETYGGSNNGGGYNYAGEWNNFDTDDFDSLGDTSRYTGSNGDIGNSGWNHTAEWKDFDEVKFNYAGAGFYYGNTVAFPVDLDEDPVVNSPWSPPVTTKNDDPKKSDVDRDKLTKQTSKMIDDVAITTGLDLNINSGYRPNGKPRHSTGQAVDINRVAGKRVDDPSNVSNVKAVQEALSMHKNIRENYGPTMNTKTLSNGTVVDRSDNSGIVNGHKDHIHASGQK